MNLIPHQVKLLHEEYKKNIEERESLIRGEQARLEGAAIMENTGETYDSIYHDGMRRIENRNKEIMRALGSASVITDYNEEQISVGSTFTVCFIDEMDEETFTLIEQKVSTEGSMAGFITLNSDFGSSVHRKKASETYAYQTAKGYLTSGIITKIFTKEEQKEYFESKEKDKQLVKAK